MASASYSYSYGGGGGSSDPTLAEAARAAASSGNLATATQQAGKTVYSAPAAPTKVEWGYRAPTSPTQVSWGYRAPAKPSLGTKVSPFTRPLQAIPSIKVKVPSFILKPRTQAEAAEGGREVDMTPGVIITGLILVAAVGYFMFSKGKD